MNAIELVTNHRTILQNELKDFVIKYNGAQPLLIAALAEKIEWMCLHIGSPSSVMPMLNSICNGKIKYWCNGDNKGKQLNSRIHRDELERKHCELTYNQIEGTDGSKESHFNRVVLREEFLKGHFRWNYGAYMCDYQTRDYIKAYFIDKNVDAYIASSTPKNTDIRLKIMSARVSRNSPNMYIVTVTTPKDNDYRFFYYVDQNKWQCNFGRMEDGGPTKGEIEFCENCLKEKFPNVLPK